jgi:acyl-coenzyme A thioesterase PaaI-like protein
MSPCRHTRKLFEFVKLSGRVEKEAGFATVLGINYESLVHRHVSFDKKHGLTVRLPLDAERLLPQRDSVSLSTYLALIDDITTWALILGDAKRSRAGKSVTMFAQRGPSTPKDEVDIVAKVKKIGRNLGFVGAEVRGAGGLVCCASHIKYLPMGFIYDTALSSYGWKAATLYSDYVLSPKSVDDAPLLSEVFDSLTFVSDSKATFEASPIHASLGGPIHGGCQAILMELVATEVAKRELETDAVELDAIHVEYMSPPSSKTVELLVDVLPHSESSEIININLRLLGEDGKAKSEGVLRYSKRAA